VQRELKFRISARFCSFRCHVQKPSRTFQASEYSYEGYNSRSVRLTTHVFLLPRLRVCATFPPFLLTSWYFDDVTQERLEHIFYIHGVRSLNLDQHRLPCQKTIRILCSDFYVIFGLTPARESRRCFSFFFLKYS